MNFTKEDFIQWRQSAITKYVFDLVAKKLATGIEELSYRAGENPITDREYVGKIAAYRDLLGISFYELEDEDEH